jgi:hypothetical protein
LLQLESALLFGLLERTHARSHICRHEYLDHKQPLFGFQRVALFGYVKIALVGITDVVGQLGGGD